MRCRVAGLAAIHVFTHVIVIDNAGQRTIGRAVIAELSDQDRRRAAVLADMGHAESVC